MSFGIELRQQRESRGVTLAAIAEGTKVSERYLRALEADDHADLPGGIFNKGMVRSYCRHLGLDEDEWLARFASTFETEGGEPDWSAFAENVKLSRQPPPRTGLRWWGVALMVVFLAAIAYATWHFLLRRRLEQAHPQTQTVGHLAPPASS